MGKISILTMMTMLSLFGYTFSLPTMDEMRTASADKEYTRDLLDWLITQQANESPCEIKERVKLSGGYWNPSQLLAKKRNSELINSLLSIPKTMNDAGK